MQSPIERTGSATVPPLVQGDTVRMPWSDSGYEDLVVRPALAILFRLALGPAADDYGPRFLHYERRGGARLGWHWPALLLGSAWAFYRKLWLTGIAFACLPLIGVAVLGAVAPAIGSSTLGWFAAAIAAIWLVPGIIAAALANALLYRHVKRRVALAEEGCHRADEAAGLISARRPTSAGAALVFGSAALALGAIAVAPRVSTLYHEQIVRVSIADSLAAFRPLQATIEDAWRRGVSLTHLPGYTSTPTVPGAAPIRLVGVNPASGRLRLELELPELRGKSILLAPAVDPQERVQWICVPVDVPRKYLPQDCARG